MDSLPEQVNLLAVILVTLIRHRLLLCGICVLCYECVEFFVFKFRFAALLIVIVDDYR
jgi:hypothetical protein